MCAEVYRTPYEPTNSSFMLHQMEAITSHHRLPNTEACLMQRSDKDPLVLYSRSEQDCGYDSYFLIVRSISEWIQMVHGQESNNYNVTCVLEKERLDQYALLFIESWGELHDNCMQILSDIWFQLVEGGSLRMNQRTRILKDFKWSKLSK